MENIGSPDWVRFIGFYSLISLLFAALYIVLYVLIRSPDIVGTFAYPTMVLILCVLLLLLCIIPYLKERQGYTNGLLLFGAGIATLVSLTILYSLWTFGTIITSVFMSNSVMEIFVVSIRYFCVFLIGFGFSTILGKVRSISIPLQISLGGLSGLLFLIGIWGLSTNAFWNAELLLTTTSEGTPNWSGQVFWLPITLLFTSCILGSSITILLLKATKKCSTRKDSS